MALPLDPGLETPGDVILSVQPVLLQDAEKSHGICPPGVCSVPRSGVLTTYRQGSIHMSQVSADGLASSMNSSI